MRILQNVCDDADDDEHNILYAAAKGKVFTFFGDRSRRRRRHKMNM